MADGKCGCSEIAWQAPGNHSVVTSGLDASDCLYPALLERLTDAERAIREKLAELRTSIAISCDESDDYDDIEFGKVEGLKFALKALGCEVENG